ncbi:MAG TPA: RNA polymerase sigma factor [Acetobacteraceae bacterium]|nr:RNA polymerase sigma factor [Acetobacteraceae bacterium]
MPALHRYARTLVANRQDADDLVQDCLVRALGKIPAESAVSVRPWLFTILHNLSVNRWRRIRRWGHLVEATETDAAVPSTQEWRVISHDLVRGFEQLSAEHRQVLMLVSVEGLEYREAAEILDVPIGTVMSRLSRARDALRAQMNGTGRPTLRRVK